MKTSTALETENHPTTNDTSEHGLEALIYIALTGQLSKVDANLGLS